MTKARMNMLLATTAVLALAACGGGGDGTAANPTQPPPTTTTTLWESPRGTGAGLVRASNSERNYIGLVADTENPGSIRTSEIIEVISENAFDFGSVSAEYVVRFSDGEVANILGTFYDEAAIYANISETRSITAAGGSQVTNMPIGDYSYRGVAEAWYVRDGVDYSEFGSFDLNANFGNRTATLVADTDFSRYSASGMSINNNGEITGSNGIYTTYFNDGTTVADTNNIDFFGTLHGSGATHVSGIAVGGATTTNDFSSMLIVGKR